LIIPAAPVAVNAAAKRLPFFKVLGTVWVPGLGMGLCCVGFGVITTFMALLFAARNWGSASLAFTAFGAAFIGARLFFAHLPDKIGGAKIALVCVVIEAAGQLLIWQANGVAMAYAGAALTGFGYSLAFPGFGVEAVRRAPPQSRGAALAPSWPSSTSRSALPDRPQARSPAPPASTLCISPAPARWRSRHSWPAISW
jgi:MFS family permease